MSSSNGTPMRLYQIFCSIVVYFFGLCTLLNFVFGLFLLLTFSKILDIFMYLANNHDSITTNLYKYMKCKLCFLIYEAESSKHLEGKRSYEIIIIFNAVKNTRMISFILFA